MKNRWRWFLIVLSLFVSSSVYTLSSIPSGYDISMYSQIPNSILFISIAFLSLSILSFYKGYIYVSLGIYLSLLWLTLLLPYLLGYTIKYGDPMIKLGNVLDLLNGAGISEGLSGLEKYPMFHTEIAVISRVTGLEPSVLFGILPAAVLLIYSVGIISISEYFKVPSKYCLLFVPLVFHNSIRSFNPSSFLYLTLVPLFVLSFYIDSQRRNLILFIISIGIWVYHLFIAIILLGMFAITQLSTRFIKWYSTQFSDSYPEITTKYFYLLYLFIGIIWIMFAQSWLFEKAILTTAQFLGLYSLRAPSNPIPGGGLGYLFNTLGLSLIHI